MPRTHACLLVSSFLLAACGETPTPAQTTDAATQDVARDALPDATPDGAMSDAAVDDATDAAPEAAPPPRYAWESVTPPGEGPLGRWGYMVAATGPGEAYVFGGTTLTLTGSGSVSSDLWRWDGRADAATFTRVTGTGAPPRRYCGCVGYIPTSRTLLMMGGRNPNEASAETWAFDVASGAWSQVMTTAMPTGLIGCQMAWSTSRGALYFFGGCGETAGCSGRTWRYDPSGPTWVRLDATGPRARYDDALVPIGDGRQLVMFAGARSASGAANFFHDVWRFDTMTEAWSELTVEGPTPPGRRNPWVSVDADGNGMLVAMGATGLQPTDVLDDLWHLDFTARTWTALTPEGDTPPPRGFVAALPVTGTSRGVLMGGFDNSGPVRDLWRLRAR
mgnify:CR=1 FL=1